MLTIKDIIELVVETEMKHPGFRVWIEFSGELTGVRVTVEAAHYKIGQHVSLEHVWDDAFVLRRTVLSSVGKINNRIADAMDADLTGLAAAALLPRPDD